MDSSLFLIPLLPLVGFLFNFTVGVRLLSPRSEGDAGDAHAHPPSPIVGLVACGTVLASFLVAVAAVVAAHQAPDHSLAQTLWTWIPGGAAETAVHGVVGATPFQVEWGYLLDPLSSVMVLVVTFVGFLIHVYSLGYMGHDPGYARYMAYLNLFMFAMLTLVLGANYAVLFVGWEGVGLCSYLLIGFWFEKQSASDAGKKAFIVNRIGDAGFLVGMFLIFVTFGTLDFRAVAEAAAHMPVEYAWGGTLTLVGLLLFIGATGKSAQLPLYVWLPDAMEGPTPVSALIHAATMVTAGVYMVARSAAIYAHAPNAMLVIALVGAATAIFAASIGLVQNDIKRVLAYSTVSQLGYMFLACGVGAFGVGVFHLYTHAFFKALLFLGSGSVIHAMSGEQDMGKMGGLRKKIPWTFWTFLVGTLAIAGIPFFAGFFSKDEILVAALGHPVLFGMGLFTALLTSFYMARLLFLTFFGSFRGGDEAEHHVHESPPSMIVPLVLLAIGSAVGGLGAATWHWAEKLHFLDVPHIVAPVLRGAEAHLRHAAWLPVVATLTAGAGILLAWYLYLAMPELRTGIASALRPALRVFRAKYYWDEVYNGFVQRVLVDGSRTLLWEKLDAGVIDGAVNRAGTITEALAQMLRPLQTGLVRHYALLILAGAVALLGWVLWS